MVTLGEQHLHQRAAQRVQFFDVAFHIESGLGGHGAGSNGAAIDLDRAQLAAAVRFEFRVVAQVRDVMAGSQCGLHHGLPLFKGNVCTIELEGVAHSFSFQVCTDIVASGHLPWHAPVRHPDRRPVRNPAISACFRKQGGNA